MLYMSYETAPAPVFEASADHTYCRSFKDLYRFLSKIGAGEEGEDDVKSAWPLTSGATHMIQWVLQWAATPRGEANP